MARQKMGNEIKPKISVSLNDKLLNILNNYLEENNVNRSKYIEHLIRKDIKNRGYNVEPNFIKTLN